MRQWLHNITSWIDQVCGHASVWFSTNQCLESALWLTNQIASATSTCSPVRCARMHFIFGLVSRASPHGSASLPTRCPQISLNSPCWLLLIRSILQANAKLFTPWEHGIYQRRLEGIPEDKCSWVYSVVIRYSTLYDTFKSLHKPCRRFSTHAYITFDFSC